jgi:serine/threonine protein phosphatase PrpC
VVLVPKLFHDDIAFCSVFDGTVGHHASEFLKNNILDHLVRRPELMEIMKRTEEINQHSHQVEGPVVSVVDTTDPHPIAQQPHDETAINYEEIAVTIRNALFYAYLDIDDSLLSMCAQNNLHYASSTGVSALIWKNLLTIAHVGDSKACIAKVAADGSVHPEWLTVDHKPHLPQELKRIEQNGGSLVWLHGNKPYIRGGDFVRRQANGEHPKQLNYSRAFGGKDLKMYGLSAQPDINHL